MKTEYTESTWYVAETGNHQGLIIDEKTGANIAVVYDKKHASLIAAVPRLLAALEEFSAQFRCDEIPNFVCEAIAEAKGE